MRFCSLGLIGLLALALAPATVSAQESKLWDYSCDHFLFGACLRIPSGMAATHSVPADFGFHVVKHVDRDVLTIYEGDAPQRPSAGRSPSLSLKSPGYRLSGYRVVEAARTRYDVYIDSDRKGVMSIHLSGTAGDEAEHKELAAALGGFRMCSFRQSRSEQTLTCPRRSEWGQQLEQWLEAAPESDER